jgi:hypothetical protein
MDKRTDPQDPSSVPFLQSEDDQIRKSLQFQTTSDPSSEKPYKDTVQINVEDGHNNNLIGPAGIGKSKPANVEGWRRYIGMIYTILAVNLFSIVTSLTKRYSYVHPFNISFFSSPASIVMTTIFLIGARVRGTPVFDTILPLRDHKKDIFLMWVSRRERQLIIFQTHMRFL